MGKLSSLAPRGPAATITATPTPDTQTFEGAPGYSYEGRSVLFLLAVTNMVGEDTFYESASQRDSRFVSLVRAAAGEDPDWLLGLVGWLRHGANLRSASVVAAVEAADTLAGTTYPRRLLAAALGRADEPGEALGYWLSARGKPIPSWLKRGLADAAARLYSEFSALKYDGQGQPIRFADVIEVSDGRHLPSSEERDRLWKWLLDRRHSRADDATAGLPLVAARAAMSEIPAETRAELTSGKDFRDLVKSAGHTWESLATWLNGPWTAAAWEAVIPSMGYMALLRNLRNFDQAGVAPSVLREVADRLADPEQVARSRQMPMRFLSAYKAVTNDRWRAPLGDALQASLANVPKLLGDTLVLIDTSGSMHSPFSRDGSLMRWDAAAVFGISFALANDLDEVFSFSNAMTRMPTPRGSSILNLVERFSREHFHNGGTATASAIREAHRVRPGAHRLLILTDEQAHSDFRGGGVVEEAKAVTRSSGFAFTFNLAGYSQGHAPAGSERFYSIGGLTDAGFNTIAQVEAGTRGLWPWESARLVTAQDA